MAWTSITEAQLEDILAEAELTTLKDFLSTDQVSPVPGIITNAVGLVRGYIRANRQNTLGDGETVPETLVSATLVVARHQLLGRLPIASLLTEPRRQEYTDAMSQLRDVAAGRFAIEQPETPSSETTPGPSIEVANSTTRLASRAKLSGL